MAKSFYKLKTTRMFTIDQIKQAHSKVKTGADFPQYIQDLKLLGVQRYDTFVIDGHSVYYGEDKYETASEAKYPELKVANQNMPEAFRHYLKMHQGGHTDYMTFCTDCAKSGVEKWTVDLKQMTCTYFDKQSVEILVEKIPG